MRPERLAWLQASRALAEARPLGPALRLLDTPLAAEAAALADQGDLEACLHRLRVPADLVAVARAWPAALPAFRYTLADGPRAILCGSDGALQGEGGPRGIVKVLNSADAGDVLFELPDPPAGRPAAWEGVLYVPTHRGLYSMDLGTGALSVVREWAAEEAGDVVRLPGWMAVVRTGEIRFWETSEK